MTRISSTRNVLTWLGLLLALTIPAWAALLAPGYFFGAHDAHHSVFYLVEFDAAIRDGAWWPRWGTDHAMGYGYPFWVVYAPFAYYVAEAFHLLGLGFTAAVKDTFLLAFLLSAAGMFLLVRRWWGDAAGLIAGLLYTYAPYHLGEATTCHIVRSRDEFKGAWWVTDDTDALRYARRQGITTMETIDLFRHAVADYDITADAGYALLHAMYVAGRNLRLPSSPADLT